MTPGYRIVADGTHYRAQRRVFGLLWLDIYWHGTLRMHHSRGMAESLIKADMSRRAVR